MLNTIGLFLILKLCLFFSACQSKEINQTQRPNIVLFLVDDMGWQDTSVPFWKQKTAYNKIYRTPNMQTLASEGMMFTQAYATPVCSPTRISLMTGMNAAKHQVTNWTLHRDKIQPMEENHTDLEFPRWNVNGLSPLSGDENAIYATPLPQLLKDAGYHTVHSGKAHFGAIGTPGENPLNLGFNVNIAGHAAGAPQSYLGLDNFGNKENLKKVWAVPGLSKYHAQDIFLTEALTIEALSAIDSVVGRQPFFLYMSHYAVHTPIMADQRYIQHYLNSGLDSIEAAYASLIEGMDKSLGDIMDYLRHKNITDNTIILFMSDNGGLSAVARGGEKHTHNKPLSSGKGSMREGGIREPMIVKWPGVVEPDSKSDNYLIIEDFFPSILEMANVDTRDFVQDVDGVSFVPHLRGNQIESDPRPLFWHYPNSWGPTGPGIGASSTVRLGDWKLIYYHQEGNMELFNIAEDIGEEYNLVSENRQKAEQLATVLSNYLISSKAQMPLYKKTGKKVPYPIELLL